MEAIRSSETSVDFERTTRLYIPKDSTQALLATCFHAGFLTYFLTLKMEAIRSSETTRRYVPEDGTLYAYVGPKI
jgi:hypothetical protein